MRRNKDLLRTRQLLFAAIFISTLCFSCTANQDNETSAEKSTVFDYTSFELKAGDLLFQDSDCGPFCDAIEKVTEGFKGSKFSHIGMVIPKKKNKLVVIEAISDGVVETPLKKFFARSFDNNNNSKVVVGRFKKAHQHLIPSAISYAKSKLDASYDDVFDINNDQYYCSELIYEAYKYANNNQSTFQLKAMTFKDPATNKTFPIWEEYFEKLNTPIPEGELGLNPGGMSKSDYINIVHLYGKPQGLNEDLP